MSALSDLIMGSNQSTSQQEYSERKDRRGPNARQQQLFDMLTRQLTGQLAKPPETAISVPQQQAVSYMQHLMGSPQLSGGTLAERLGSSGSSGTGGSMGSFTPTSQSGQPQAGLQTRQELGIPDRESYTPAGFVPSPEQVMAIGLPNVRAGTQWQRKENNKQRREQAKLQKQEAKLAKRGM
jgi:hypothetical protein